jgi:DNA-repair protein XRCC3
VGCDVLDSSLQGGLLVPGLTEIAGTSAAGKTQLCLQLCLTSQLPRECGGLEAGAVYICTGDVFPSKRLRQLTEFFIQDHSKLKLTVKNISDNIYVEHVPTISSLTAQLEYRLPSLLATGRVKLMVIDSIAALFRSEYGVQQVVQRAQVLQACGSRLQHLSETYGVAVVCVNQVTAAMGSGRESTTGVRPALGLAWASLVGTRIMLHRDEVLGNSPDDNLCKVGIPSLIQVSYVTLYLYTVLPTLPFPRTSLFTLPFLQNQILAQS